MYTKYTYNIFFITLILYLFTTSLHAIVSGVVYKDLPRNNQAINTYGIQDSNELGLKNIKVTAYPENISTLTDVNGSWELNTTQSSIRIEFSSIPSYLKVSTNQNKLNSTIQFILDGSTHSRLGLHNPSEYIDSTPSLVTTHFVNGNNNVAGLPTLYSWKYNNFGLTNSNQKVRVTTDDARSIWGLAYNRSTKTLYSSTLLRRHSAIGSYTLGTIYRTNLDTNVTTQLLDIPNAGTINKILRGLNNHLQPNTDANAFSKVAKVGLGDIAISEDESTLYVMNLNDKKIYEINLKTEVISKSYDSPAPTCVNGINRPFALSYHNGSLYSGSVCDASSANCDTSIPNNCSALTAHIFKIATGTTTGSEIFSMRLDYEKEYAMDSQSLYEGTHRFWNAWNDTYANMIVTIAINDKRLIFPTPILSNIKFDEHENLLLAFTDRTALQGGASQNDIHGQAIQKFTYSGGDILKASLQNDGSYVLNDVNFYDDNTTVIHHKEGALGALHYIMGSNETIFTQYDNLNAGIHTEGVTKLNNKLGSKINAYRIVEDNRPVFFGKSVGIGDLEIITTPITTEVGNYIWSDDNSNCIQDANESGINDVTIHLLSNNIIIDTQVTNNNGHYLFENINPNEDYIIRINDLTQPALTNKTLTTCSNNGGEGLNSLLNNNDAIINNTNADITLSADSIKIAGANNHSFDIGFKPLNPNINLIVVPPNRNINLYTLGNRLWLDSNQNGIQDNNESGHSGATVTLYNTSNCLGSVLASTTTGNDGLYQFNNLLAGDYCIAFTNLPSEHNITIGNQGTDNNSDSNANASGEITDISLTANDDTQDIGIFSNINTSVLPPNRNINLYTLGNRLWLDSNQNGIQDNNESGHSGATVTLYNTSNCSGSVLASTTTGNDGLYQFNNLLAGDYCVAFTNLPSEHNITIGNQGTDNNSDSNANASGEITDISLTANDDTQDIGIFSTVNIIVLPSNHNNGTCTCHPYESKSISTLNLFGILLLIFLTYTTSLHFKDKI